MITFSLYRQIRKFGKLLRGGAGQHEIFLGMFCGILIGMIPGFNLTLLLFILVSLLLNANLGFSALGTLLGTALCFLLAPISYESGYLIIHQLGMEDLFRSAANAPVLALMSLDTYALIGGLPYALIIAFIGGKLAVKFMAYLRMALIKTEESKKLSFIVTNPLSKTLMWLAFGKQKVTSKDALEKESSHFRKFGFVLVILFLVTFGILQFFLLNPLTRYSLESAISTATGAEANIKTCDLSLTDGKMTLSGVQITDPGKPTHNLIAIDSLINDISITDLLRQSFTIDLMSGSGAKFNDLRSSPGKIYRPLEDEEEEPIDPSDPGSVIDDYIKEAEKWYEYAKKIEEFLEYFESEPETEEERKQRELEERKRAITMGYLKAHAGLVKERPLLVIRKIEIHDIQISNQYPKQSLTATEVSTHPKLNGLPFSINLFDLKEKGAPQKNNAGKINVPVTRGISAGITLNLHEQDALHALDLMVPDIPIASTFKISKSLPIEFNDGGVDFKLDGTFNQKSLSMPFKLNTSNLDMKVPEGSTLLGMNAATATQALKGILQVDVEGNFTGKLKAPRIAIETQKLMDHFQQNLIANGKQQLLNQANMAIDKYVDKAADKLDGEVGKQLDKALGEHKGAVNELLGPFKKKILGGNKSENDKRGNDENDSKKNQDEKKDSGIGDSVKKKSKDLLKKLF